MVVFDVLNLIREDIKVGIFKFSDGNIITLRAYDSEKDSLITEISEDQLGYYLHQEVKNIMAPAKDVIVLAGLGV